jgi:hypothetical protein
MAFWSLATWKIYDSRLLMKQARKLACLIEGCSTFLLLLIDYFYCCTRTIGSAVNHLILLFFDVVLLTKLQTNISIAGVLSTPFTPSISLDASFLYCTTNETADLVAKFFASTEITVGYPEQLPEILFRLTAGHIDMLLFLLKDLYNAFKYLAQEEQVDPRAFFNYLLSHRVGQSISRSRGAPNFDHLPEKSKSYLIHLLEQGTGSRLEVADERESFRDLMQRYILRWDDTLGAVCFLSPAVERLAFFELYASPRARLDVSSLGDFIKRTLFAMRADFLRNNLGVSRTGVLLERVWQAEVYRAATSILPIGTFISHEVGHIFNTRGMVDFYVNDTKQWLIEITRGGDKLREHVDRLQGIYASIPRKEEVILIVWRKNNQFIYYYRLYWIFGWVRN